MYVDNDKHINSAKINYLILRANSAYYTAEEKITKAFNLAKPDQPKTPEDLVTAITSGNYTILPKEERGKYWSSLDSIVWRAPTVKADPEGAKAAYVEFHALKKNAIDTIMVKTADEGLVAVQALDAWTPTVTA